MGIVGNQANKFPKTLFFPPFLSIMFNIYILNVKNQNQEYFEHYIMALNKGT